MSAIVGYRRVSSTDQRLDRQGLGECSKVFEDRASGKDRDRPGLTACLTYIRRATPSGPTAPTASPARSLTCSPWSTT